MEGIGFPNDNALSVMVPSQVLLTLYSENAFRGDSLYIDGATTTSKIGGQMECINLNGRNFGNRTSSLKVMHKNSASPAIGRW